PFPTRRSSDLPLAPPQPSHGGMTAMATIQKINGIKQTWHTIEFSNNHPPNNNPTKPAGPPSGSKKPTAHNTKPSRTRKANQSSQTNTHHSTPQNASSSTNQAYQQANSKVKSANRDPNHTPATKHKTPNAPHSQPARSQNQPTDQLSQQHEVQQLNRINSLHTADHKSQPNPEPGTVYKNFQNQQPCLNAPVTGTP